MQEWNGETKQPRHNYWQSWQQNSDQNRGSFVSGRGNFRAERSYRVSLGFLALQRRRGHNLKFNFEIFGILRKVANVETWN